MLFVHFKRKYRASWLFNSLAGLQKWPPDRNLAYCTSGTNTLMVSSLYSSESSLLSITLVWDRLIFSNNSRHSFLIHSVTWSSCNYTLYEMKGIRSVSTITNRFIHAKSSLLRIEHHLVSRTRTKICVYLFVCLTLSQRKTTDLI